MARVLVALGGNAIRQPRERGTAAEQIANIDRTSAHIAEMIVAGHEVVITHGNGPQVGNILLQNELARGKVPAMPLDICGAESQGELGYLIQQSLANELQRRGQPRDVVTVLTRTLVDKNDPAFRRPSKPVGPFVTAAEAEQRERAHGEVWVEDAGRGWRRVVPSPQPLAIVEAEVIARLSAQGVIVIAAGGGGVPVVMRPDGTLVGVEAVIDKDLAAARLGQQLGVEVLLILTDVPGVAVGYGGPEPRFLRQTTVTELEELMARGAFPAGSMGPKVAGALAFLRGGGERAAICSLDEAEECLAGRAGTQITAPRTRTRLREGRVA